MSNGTSGSGETPRNRKGRGTAYSETTEARYMRDIKHAYARARDRGASHEDAEDIAAEIGRRMLCDENALLLEAAEREAYVAMAGRNRALNCHRNAGRRDKAVTRLGLMTTWVTTGPEAECGFEVHDLVRWLRGKRADLAMLIELRFVHDWTSSETRECLQVSNSVYLSMQRQAFALLIVRLKELGLAD